MLTIPYYRLLTSFTGRSPDYQILLRKSFGDLVTYAIPSSNSDYDIVIAGSSYEKIANSSYSKIVQKNY